MKTTFGKGTLVPSKFLSASQHIRFDGKDEDFHYPPINLNDIQFEGRNGFDTAFVTLETDQVVSGSKSFMGPVTFGEKDRSVAETAPKSWSTNAKFETPTFDERFLFGGDAYYFQKLNRLDPEDLITKKILNELLTNLPIFDEGLY